MKTIRSSVSDNFYKRYKRYYTYVEPIVSDPLVHGYFALAASLVLITVFIIFALSPTMNTIAGLIRKIEDQKQVLNKLDEKINNLILANEKYGQYEESFSLLDEALPSTPMPETLLSRLWPIINQPGVAVTSLQFGSFKLFGTSLESGSVTLKESKEKQGLHSLEFSLNLTGDVKAIEGVLKKMENSSRIIKINSVVFSKSPEISQSETIVNLTGTAHYLVNQTK